MEHLHALELRRSNERQRLAIASNEEERELRTVWVNQIDREIEAERKLLGLPSETALPEMEDDTLLAELGVES